MHPSKFTDDNFPSVMNSLSEWIGEAQKTGNHQETRGRAEAVIQFLLQNKDRLYNKLPFDAMISEMEESVATLPKPAALPSLPDVPETNGPPPDIRKGFEEDIKIITRLADDAPEQLENDLKYCLRATRGQRVPDSPLDFDHLFAMLIKQLGLSIKYMDVKLYEDTVAGFEKLCEYAVLNPGYSRKQLTETVRRLNGSELPPLQKQGNALPAILAGTAGLLGWCMKSLKEMGEAMETTKFFGD